MTVWTVPSLLRAPVIELLHSSTQYELIYGHSLFPGLRISCHIQLTGCGAIVQRWE
jgi:hypothetical protein